MQCVQLDYHICLAVDSFDNGARAEIHHRPYGGPGLFPGENTGPPGVAIFRTAFLGQLIQVAGDRLSVDVGDDAVHPGRARPVDGDLLQ